jgi:hypothetical protein
MNPGMGGVGVSLNSRMCRAGWLVVAVLVVLLGCSKGEQASPHTESSSRSVSQALEPSAWPAQAVVATNSIELQDRLHVTGDIAVVQASNGPWLSSNAELAASYDSAPIFADAPADRIEASRGRL